MSKLPTSFLSHSLHCQAHCFVFLGILEGRAVRGGKTDRFSLVLLGERRREAVEVIVAVTAVTVGKLVLVTVTEAVRTLLHLKGQLGCARCKE